MKNGAPLIINAFLHRKLMPALFTFSPVKGSRVNLIMRVRVHGRFDLHAFPNNPFNGKFASIDLRVNVFNNNSAIHGAAFHDPCFSFSYKNSFNININEKALYHTHGI
jgi:hypothetical protein